MWVLFILVTIVLSKYCLIFHQLWKILSHCIFKCFFPNFPLSVLLEFPWDTYWPPHSALSLSSRFSWRHVLGNFRRSFIQCCFLHSGLIRWLAIYCKIVFLWLCICLRNYISFFFNVNIFIILIFYHICNISFISFSHAFFFFLLLSDSFTV